MKLRKQILAVALAVSMAVSGAGAPGIQVTGVKAAGETETQTGGGNVEADGNGSLTTTSGEEEGTEEAIKITDMTIAPTYYNVGDKFPLYMEFQTEEKLTDEERSNLVLTVKDTAAGKDIAVVTGASINGGRQYYFQTSEEEEYADVESGKSYSLDFTISIVKNDSFKQEIKTESKTVSFQNKSVWSDRKYLDTGRESYYLNDLNFVLPVADNKRLEAVYLVNQQGKVVAGTEKGEYFSSGSGNDERYQGIFNNKVSLVGGKLYSVSKTFYRSRKIESGNLQIMVRFEDGETYFIKEDVFQVTEAPYISSVGIGILFAGEDDIVIGVSGNHIDFTKLSLVLKGEKAGKVVGRSVSSVTTSQQKEAFYTIRWEEGYQPINNDFYNVKFQYPEAVIVEDTEKEVVYYGNTFSFPWNPRTDSIELYSRELSGQVSYEIKKSDSSDSDVLKSGTVDVDNSHHIVMPLEGACKVSGEYYFSVTYKDSNGAKKTTGSYIDIYVNGSASGGSGNSLQPSSSYLSNYFYLSNQTEFLFTAGLYCNDESKFSEECSAVIRNKNTGAELGTVSVTKQRSGNSQYYSYSGSYRGNLGAGRYTLSFQPDKETELTYDFYVLDSSKLCVTGHSNEQDKVYLSFGSSDAAKWYCSEENQKKLSVQVFDIEKNKIAEYPLSSTEGFTVSENADNSSRTLIFSEKMKEDLKDYYYYNIYVYYNGERAVSAYDLSQSLYEYYRYEERYLRSDEMENGYIGLSGNYDRGRYEYNYIYGTAGTFPVKITIMDWYRLDFSNPVATITVDSPGSLEGKLSGLGLSGTKLYGFYLEGQNGTYDREFGYASVEGGSDIPDTDGSDGGGTTSVVPSVPPVSDSDTDKKEEEQKKEENQEQAQKEEQPKEETPKEQISEDQTPVIPEDSDQEEQKTPEDNSGTATESKKKSKGKLTLKKKKLVLKKGQKSRIKITSKLNTGVTYRSLDTSIAKVNKNGVVTGKKKGKTTIVVKANGKKKKVKVTIKAVNSAKDSSKITIGKNLKLSKKKVILKKGTKITIGKASGVGKVTFRSLNKKIASVSVKGVIKARKKGKTAVVIKGKKKTARLKITVKR